jgi:hypothetical protein
MCFDLAEEITRFDTIDRSLDITSKEVEEICSKISHNLRDILKDENLSRMRVLVRNLGESNEAVRIRLFSCLMSSLEKCIRKENYSIQIVECYMFFVYQIINYETRNIKSESLLKQDMISIVSLLQRIVTETLMRSGELDKLIVKIVFTTFDRLRDNTQKHSMCCIIVKLYKIPVVQQSIIPMFVQYIRTFENSGDMLARIALNIVKETGLGDEFCTKLFMSISNMRIDAINDITTIKNLSKFLTSISEKAPRNTLNEIDRITELLNHESYLLRICVIETIGHLIVYCVDISGLELENRVNSLFGMIERRARDLNAFVRSKAIQTLSELCSQGVVTNHQYQMLIDLGIERVLDKSSNVRRRAIQLLGNFVHHCFFEIDQTLITSISQLKLDQSLVDEKDGHNPNLRACNGSNQFMCNIKGVFPILDRIVLSHNRYEVVDVIEFIKLTYKCGIPNAEESIRKMIHLIWQQDVRDSIASLYREIYLDDNSSNTDQVVRNLLELVQRLSCSELTSFKEIVRYWTREQIIHDKIYQILLEKALNIKESLKIRRSAIALISFCFTNNAMDGLVSLIEQQFTTENLDHIIISYLLQIIQEIYSEDKHIDVSCGVVRHLVEIVLSNISTVISRYCTNEIWFNVIQRLIIIVYRFSTSPDLLCENLIKQLILDRSKSKLDSFILSRLLFVSGCVCIQQFIYLNRIQSVLKTKLELNNKQEDYCHQIDGDQELIKDYELLYGDNVLLRNLAQLVVEICSDISKVGCKLLRRTAATTLAKFMCTSSKFCIFNLKLFLEILSNSEDEALCCNLVIGFGDLIRVHGNLIDQNVGNLFHQLSNSNVIVRRNALIISSRLILNGVIKGRKYIGELIIMVEDSDPQILELTKLFFARISDKDPNYVYNNLPDIVSFLSSLEPEMEEERSRRIITYTTGFIKREQQIEKLIDKFCQRFRINDQARQWRILSFCLLSLIRNGKQCKRLYQHSKLYRDKLRDEIVRQCFQSIIFKIRKSVGNEDHAWFAEFEGIVNSSETGI